VLPPQRQPSLRGQRGGRSGLKSNLEHRAAMPELAKIHTRSPAE
jgi:hypothetical protein